MIQNNKTACTTQLHCNKALSQVEIEHALTLLFNRMDTIKADCGEKFPLFSPDTQDNWLLSKRGSWAGGFWGGWWWLRAKVTGDSTAKAYAENICHKLAPQLATSSINRSLIFWYGCGLGAQWFGDSVAKKLCEKASNVLASSYCHALGIVPLGVEMGGGPQGDERCTIDSLASCSLLLTKFGSNHNKKIAKQHAETLLTLCCSKHGTYHSAINLVNGTLQPQGVAGTWSRGQAWAMLALSQAAIYWGEPYLSHAHAAANYWKHTRPLPNAPSNLNKPNGPADPSATLIASIAILQLGNRLPDESNWRIYVHQQVRHILSNTYFTGFTNNEKQKASGIFWGNCYNIANNKQALVECVWGSFFLTAVLSVLGNKISADEI